VPISDSPQIIIGRFFAVIRADRSVPVGPTEIPGQEPPRRRLRRARTRWWRGLGADDRNGEHLHPVRRQQIRDDPPATEPRKDRLSEQGARTDPRPNQHTARYPLGRRQRH
jgi:hypothetical protein